MEKSQSNDKGSEEFENFRIIDTVSDISRISIDGKPLGKKIQINFSKIENEDVDENPQGLSTVEAKAQSKAAPGANYALCILRMAPCGCIYPPSMGGYAGPIDPNTGGPCPH